MAGMVAVEGQDQAFVDALGPRARPGRGCCAAESGDGEGSSSKCSVSGVMPANEDQQMPDDKKLGRGE